MEEHLEDSTGTPAKKPRLDEPKPGPSGTQKSGKTETPLQIMKQGYMKGLNIPPRCPQHLKFDMALTQYIAEGNLAFNHLQSAAFKNLCKNIPELRMYTVKNPSTFSRAKLPLLYEQVHDKVDAMIKKDLKGTTGFAFTSDLWSSR